MASLKNQAFKASLGKWAQGAGDKLDGMVRIAVQDLAEAVIDDTPIDTGFLVSNWQPSLEEPMDFEMIDRPANWPFGHGEGDPGAAVAALALSVPDMKVGLTFFYVNNVKYAPAQEYGTEKMVGRFMVTQNIAKWQAFVESAAIQMGLGV